MDSDDDDLPSEHVQAFRTFLETSCAGRIAAVVREPDATAHYAVEVDIMQLEAAHPEASEKLMMNPKAALPLLHEALCAAISDAADAVPASDDAYAHVSAKPNVHARPWHAPLHAGATKQNVSMLRTQDVGKFLAVLGTVTRTGSCMLREVEREYCCTKCKYSFMVKGDITQRGAFDLPGRCPSATEAGGAAGALGKRKKKPCYGSAFIPVEVRSERFCVHTLLAFMLCLSLASSLCCFF